MLKLNAKLKNEILNHVGEDAKREVCGILAGQGDKIAKIYKMRNTAETPALCYFMDPKEQFKVMKEMRAAGQEMLAIYHSHVESESYPSKTDVELAYYPEAFYVIISPKGMRAFRIVENKITEEEIKII